MADSLKHYFQLIEVFTIREIKSRYKASILGPLWIVLYPLFTAVILNLVFGRFVKINTGNIPYFLFLLSGIIFWNFFQQSVTLAKDSLVWNRELITKTSFNKEVLPLSYVFSKLADFFVFVGVFLIFYLLLDFRIDFYFALIILLVIPIVLFSAGISLIVSAANAVFRDFGRMVDFFLMFVFYFSPIVYPVSSIPEKYKLVILINPLSQAIVILRQGLFKHRFSFDLFLISLVVSVIVFLIGLLFFKKVSKKLADLI